MKRWHAQWRLAALAAVCGLVGCVVPSLSPLFEEEQCVAEPDIVGKWEKMDGETRSLETLEIAVKDKGYSIVNVDKDGKKATLQVQLGKIDGQEYLCGALDPESLPSTSVWFVGLPQHFLIFKVEQVKPELRLVPLNYDACAKLLQKNPAAVAHVKMVYPKKNAAEKEDSPLYFLTADPAGLQKFIKENAEESVLFNPDSKLVFVRPEEAARRNAAAEAARAVQEAAQAARREAEFVKRYDVDGDGKLSPEERQRADAAEKAAQRNAANPILAPPLE